MQKKKSPLYEKNFQSDEDRTQRPDYPYKINILPASNMASHAHILLHLRLLLFLPEAAISHSISLPHNQTRERDSRDNSNDARARHGSRAARFGAAAGAVVGDVVPLGGDFEDGAWAWVAAVVVVDEEEIGWGAVIACARKS